MEPKLAPRREPLWLWALVISGAVAFTLTLIFLVLYGAYSKTDCGGLGCFDGTEWLVAAGITGLAGIVLWLITGVAWFVVVDKPRRAGRATPDEPKQSVARCETAYRYAPWPKRRSDRSVSDFGGVRCARGVHAAGYLPGRRIPSMTEPAAPQGPSSVGLPGFEPSPRGSRSARIDRPGRVAASRGAEEAGPLQDESDSE